MKSTAKLMARIASTAAISMFGTLAHAGHSDILRITRTGVPDMIVDAVYEKTLDEGNESGPAFIMPDVIFADKLRLFDFSPTNPNFDPNNPNADPDAPFDENGNARVRTVVFREQDGTVSDVVKLAVDPVSPQGLSVQYTQLSFAGYSDPGLPSNIPSGGLFETGGLQDITPLLFPGYFKPGQQATPPFMVQFQSDLDVPEPASLILMGIGLAAVAGRVWCRRDA